MKKKFKLVMTTELELENIDDITDVNPLVLLATTVPLRTVVEVFDAEGELVMKDVLK